MFHFRNLVRGFSNLRPVQLVYTSYENGVVSDRTLPPLIISHGLFGSKSNWNSLSKVITNKTHRKVINVDNRNHGESPHADEHSYVHMVSDMEELFSRLKLDKVSLLGHSMGGRAVMYFALKNPSFVEKLIVVDISPVTTSPNLGTMPQLFHVIETTDLPRNVPMSQARRHVDLQLAVKIEDKDLRNFLLTNLVQNGDGSYKWRINISSLSKNFHELARFPPIGNLTYHGPTLFIGGEDSDYIPREDHEEILRMFPNAEFRYIEDAGHWLHMEKPGEFLRHAVDFLNKHK